MTRPIGLRGRSPSKFPMKQAIGAMEKERRDEQASSKKASDIDRLATYLCVKVRVKESFR
jgi:hypothetical protein